MWACVALAVALASRQPEPTPTPAPTPEPVTIYVSAASGQPVYLFNSPTIGDRIQVYAEGTPLEIVGGDVEGDGLIWHFVRAPDGNVINMVNHSDE